MSTPENNPEREERRRSILAAAVETFAERGFAAARTRDIARAAGIAEGTIYLYFEGKDDLLLTAFRETVSSFVATASELLGSTASFAERLEHFVRMHLAGIEAEPELATVLLLESRQSSRFFGEPVREVLREYAAAVDRLIESGRADGEVRDDVDVPTARRILIGTLEEVELAWLLGPRTRPLTPQAEPITRILLRGVATTGDGG